MVNLMFIIIFWDQTIDHLINTLHPAPLNFAFSYLTVYSGTIKLISKMATQVKTMKTMTYETLSTPLLCSSSPT